MNRWFLLNLGDAMLAEAAKEHIQSVFSQEYLKTGQPMGMAIFQKHVSDGHLHCDLMIYFSPAQPVRLRMH